MFIMAATLVVIVPFFINEAYKKGGDYITVWTGAEFLAYYGTILGAVATIIALSGTIIFTRRQILFERYVRRETERWREIEHLFQDAIISADPIHLTALFYNNLANDKACDACLELETYLTRLSETIDRLNITIEEKDMPKLNELLVLLEEIEMADKRMAREYDDLVSYYRQLCVSSLTHSDLIREFAAQRDKINLEAKNLRQREYQNIMQRKKTVFAEIYDGIDEKSQNILMANG